jgi:hypothetical protein
MASLALLVHLVSLAKRECEQRSSSLAVISFVFFSDTWVASMAVTGQINSNN